MADLLFVASKVVGALILAETWFVLVLCACIWALHRALIRAARRLLLGTVTAVVTLAVLPLGDPLLQSIERTYPANPALDRVDGIVVLGGGEEAGLSRYWQQVQLNDGGERFTSALELARRFPAARVLFTGGSGRLRDVQGANVREANVAESFFRAQGITAPRLLLEGESRNTVENATRSLPLARPQPGEVWVLVTTAYHLPRAMRSFAQAGWPPLVPYPVDYRTGSFADGIGWDLSGHLGVLNIAVRERIGQLAYRLLGR